MELQNKQQIAVFSSGNRASFARYNQYLPNLLNCSLCEVDQYRHFFDLTDQDVALLKEYMGLYEKIRRCCGLQMSKYNFLRLHGCDISAFVERPDYPHCERENLTDVEERFAAIPIGYKVSEPKYNWGKPGDCTRFDTRIVSEKKGFNGHPFQGCDALS